MNKSAKQNEYKSSAKPLNSLSSDKQSLSDTKAGKINYKNISIPGAPLIEEIFDVLEPQNEGIINKQGFGLVKIHKAKNKTLLEGDIDLFVFKEPSAEKRQEKKPILTQIPTSFNNKKDSKENTIKENVFLNPVKPGNSNTAISGKKITTEASQASAALPRNKYKKQRTAQKSSSFIIATLFLLIFVSAIFVLQAADIFDLSYVASLFNNTNYSAEVTNKTTTMPDLIKSNML